MRNCHKNDKFYATAKLNKPIGGHRGDEENQHFTDQHMQVYDVKFSKSWAIQWS